MDSSELLVVIELVVLINPNLSLGRETDRETERQRDRQTERQRDRETGLVDVINPYKIAILVSNSIQARKAQ